MRGLIHEMHSETIGEESKHLYVIVVLTETGLVSIQCDASHQVTVSPPTPSAAGGPASLKSQAAPVEVKAKYQKRTDSTIDRKIGYFTCFNQGI